MIIYCKKCKRDIGDITIKPNGTVVYNKENGILSTRFRFDGNWGFQCACGNDSRLAAAEQGIIGATAPTLSDINEINTRLQKKATLKLKTAQGAEVDGFIMKGLDGSE